MAGDFDWYIDAIEGKNPPIHEGRPQCGYFWKASANKDDRVRLPVAIWREKDGTLAGRVGFEDATMMKRGDDVSELWSWVAKNPVAADLYWQAFEARAWPNDMLPADKRFGSDGLAMPGDNRPPVEKGSIADFQQRIAEIAEVAEQAGRYVDGKWMPVDTQDDADKVQNAKDQLAKILKEAQAAYVVAKTPSETALKAVRDEWFGLTKPLEETVSTLGTVVNTYLRAENKRRADLAKAAAEAAEAARKAAAPPEVVEAAVAEAAAVAAPARVLAGGAVTGRRTGARVNRKGKIVDYAAFIAAAKDAPEIKEAAQTAANRLARNQVPTPGMEIYEE